MRRLAGSQWHPVLDGVRLILLDFDGPLVRLLPNPKHIRLAQQLLKWYSEQTGESLDYPAVDHVSVLRQLNQVRPELTAGAETIATAAELAAARRTSAYPEAISAVNLWLAERGELAIVSNNAEEAVRTIVGRTGLNGYTVHARLPDTVSRLKPQPDLLLDAMARHQVAPAHAVMIGDSVGDLIAARAAGVVGIGIAETARRAAELRAAGAVLTVPALAELSLAAPALGGGNSPSPQ